jgi:hypothetical protein
VNAAHTILGVAVGIVIGAMDFSLARGIASMIRVSNARAAQALIMGGFVLRLGAIGILLWTMSRATNLSFPAVCVGLTGAFTVLIVWQAFRSFTDAGREHKQVSDRR